MSDGAEPPMAEQIARDWSALLGREVDVDTDYRDAGGNSLIALRMVAKLRERFGAPVTIADLVVHGTPGEVAALVSRRLAGT